MEKIQEIKLDGVIVDDISLINGNFMKCATNFADLVEPDEPQSGMTFYNKNTKKLMIYDEDKDWTSVTTDTSHSVDWGDITLRPNLVEKIYLGDKDNHIIPNINGECLLQSVSDGVNNGLLPYDDYIKFKEYDGRLNNLFTSVSDGKTLIARSITDKGIQTNPSDSFKTMADNIMFIPTVGSESEFNEYDKFKYYFDCSYIDLEKEAHPDILEVIKRNNYKILSHPQITLSSLMLIDCDNDKLYLVYSTAATHLPTKEYKIDYLKWGDWVNPLYKEADTIYESHNDNYIILNKDRNVMYNFKDYNDYSMREFYVCEDNEYVSCLYENSGFYLGLEYYRFTLFSVYNEVTKTTELKFLKYKMDGVGGTPGEIIDASSELPIDIDDTETILKVIRTTASPSTDPSNYIKQFISIISSKNDRVIIRSICYDPETESFRDDIINHKQSIYNKNLDTYIVDNILLDNLKNGNFGIFTKRDTQFDSFSNLYLLNKNNIYKYSLDLNDVNSGWLLKNTFNLPKYMNYSNRGKNEHITSYSLYSNIMDNQNSSLTYSFISDYNGNACGITMQQGQEIEIILIDKETSLYFNFTKDMSFPIFIEGNIDTTDTSSPKKLFIDYDNISGKMLALTLNKKEIYKDVKNTDTNNTYSLSNPIKENNILFTGSLYLGGGDGYNKFNTAKTLSDFNDPNNRLDYKWFGIGDPYWQQDYLELLYYKLENGDQEVNYDTVFNMSEVQRYSSKTIIAEFIICMPYRPEYGDEWNHFAENVSENRWGNYTQVTDKLEFNIRLFDENYTELIKVPAVVKEGKIIATINHDVSNSKYISLNISTQEKNSEIGSIYGNWGLYNGIAINSCSVKFFY